jgi:hypothetical protein
MDNKLLTILMCLLVASCGGETTFHEYARGGDTVAVLVGTQPTFNRNNITVTISPSTGSPIVLTAADPAVRAVINLYPDPLSNMVVSREIQENTAPSSYGYSVTTLGFANDDKDYFQTTVFIDLPIGIALGLAQINITDSTGATHDSKVEIIAGTGTPNLFKAAIPGSDASFDVDNVMRTTLARSPHTEVAFSSNTIPQAIEINFTHDPDKTVGGTGKAFVVNPLGYIKNLSWNDDGTNLKVILIQATENIITHMNDYKFYVAGTVENLQLSSIKAYDSNGNDSIDAVIPTLTVRN